MESFDDDHVMYRAGHKLAEEVTMMALHGLDGDLQSILSG
jgi:hypothetical protein